MASTRQFLGLRLGLRPNEHQRGSQSPSPLAILRSRQTPLHPRLHLFAEPRCQLLSAIRRVQLTSTFHFNFSHHARETYTKFVTLTTDGVCNKSCRPCPALMSVRPVSMITTKESRKEVEDIREGCVLVGRKPG